MEHFEEVIALLTQITEDDTLPKSIKTNIQNAIKNLEECSGDTSMLCDRSLELLENLDTNPNTPQHVRTQLWSIATILESTR